MEKRIKIVKLVDRTIGSILCALIGIIAIFSLRYKEREIKKILVIQLWGIGETILTLPTISALHKRFPKGQISILATKRNKDIYREIRYIKNIFLLNFNIFSIILFIIKNFKQFDLVIDMEEYLNISALISFFTGKRRIGFSHGTRSLLYTDKIEYNDKQHVVHTFLDLVRLLGVEYSDKVLVKLPVSPKDKKIVKEFLKKNKISSKHLIIGIAPGTGESATSRVWPKDNYAKLADILIKRYKAKIIFIGSKNESRLIKEIQDLMENKSINAAGIFNLKQSIYLIENCDLFISNDSGPMHIAAAQRVKTIGLFGPNHPKRFAPYGPNTISLYKGSICKHSPCINVHKGQIPECKLKDNICMKAIGVKDVLKVVDKLI